MDLLYEIAQLERELRDTNAKLNMYNKNSMGLTMDSAKDYRWKLLREHKERCWKTLQALNTMKVRAKKA